MLFPKKCLGKDLSAIVRHGRMVLTWDLSTREAAAALHCVLVCTTQAPTSYVCPVYNCVSTGNRGREEESHENSELGTW